MSDCKKEDFLAEGLSLQELSVSRDLTVYMFHSFQDQDIECKIYRQERRERDPFASAFIPF